MLRHFRPCEWDGYGGEEQWGQDKDEDRNNGNGCGWGHILDPVQHSNVGVTKIGTPHSLIQESDSTVERFHPHMG